MDIGDWVHFPYNGEKITGFIIAKTEENIAVQVTIPTPDRVIEIPQTEVVMGSCTIWFDDIPTLIDLALATKDKQWFEKWIQEFSLWKPIQTVIAP